MWSILVAALLSAVAGVTTIDSSMMMICIDMDAEGTYFWNIGWMAAVFGFMNNAMEGQAVQFDDVSDAEVMFPIPNTMRYAQNAGSVLVYIDTVS